MNQAERSDCLDEFDRPTKIKIMEKKWMLDWGDKRKIHYIMTSYRSAKKGVNKTDIVKAMYEYIENLIHKTHDTIK